MKSKPRICVTCGTTYEYCPKCTKDADKPVWMVAFHTEECRKVYNIIATSNLSGCTTNVFGISSSLSSKGSIFLFCTI